VRLSHNIHTWTERNRREARTKKVNKMEEQTKVVLEAVKKLDGILINSHKDVYDLCDGFSGSHRRIGMEIDKLINSGLIVGGSVDVDGLTRFKYEVIK